MLLFNLYISIVNRKISWPVLVLDYFFLANFKAMYYYYYYYHYVIVISFLRKQNSAKLSLSVTSLKVKLLYVK